MFVGPTSSEHFQVLVLGIGMVVVVVVVVVSVSDAAPDVDVEVGLRCAARCRGPDFFGRFSRVSDVIPGWARGVRGCPAGPCARGTDAGPWRGFGPPPTVFSQSLPQQKINSNPFVHVGPRIPDTVINGNLQRQGSEAEATDSGGFVTC